MATDYERSIRDTLAEFDFAKVHQTMWLLRWNWSSAKFGVPLEIEIKDAAEELLTEAVAMGPGSRIESGGLVAECLEGGVCLQFVLTSWSDAGA